jgi:predicted DCC family thiol-disulfide oxidoreductase YuxK
LGWLLLVPPVSWLAIPVYALVARYRYRMPGSTDACRIDHT